MRKMYAMALAVGMGVLAQADVVLPKIIGSKMILQRGVAAPVWGWADQGEEVTVRFAGQTKTAMPDATGKWMVRLDQLKASADPRVMTISGQNSIELRDVLVGEVWLASGQSNMEWPFGVIAKDEQDFAVAQKGNRLVRAFHVEKHLLAGVPMDDTIGRWKTADQFINLDWSGISATGFFFALKLQKELGVPVAILDANWGGQRIEQFIPAEGYEAVGIECRKKPVPAYSKGLMKDIAASVDASVKASERGIKIPYIEEHAYGWSENGIYNAMIAPLTPYAIKGTIWYQGESNRDSSDYFKKLQALSAGWSQVFNVKAIPLYQVQIAPFDYNRGGNPADSTLCDNIWAAQYRGAKEIPGVGIVAIHDTDIDVHNIHPVRKRPVGERLAAQALNKQYGKAVLTTGPEFASATRDGAKVMISFSNIDQGLCTTDGKAPFWFELSADGQTFVKADAVIHANRVEVSSEEVPVPAFVRMGWYDVALPNLSDKNGWPVFAFPAKAVQ